jgi:hypothetical protein
MNRITQAKSSVLLEIEGTFTIPHGETNSPSVANVGYDISPLSRVEAASG